MNQWYYRLDQMKEGRKLEDRQKIGNTFWKIQLFRKEFGRELKLVRERCGNKKTGKFQGNYKQKVNRICILVEGEMHAQNSVCILCVLIKENRQFSYFKTSILWQIFLRTREIICFRHDESLPPFQPVLINNFIFFYLSTYRLINQNNQFISKLPILAWMGLCHVQCLNKKMINQQKYQQSQSQNNPSRRSQKLHDNNHFRSQSISKSRKSRDISDTFSFFEKKKQSTVSSKTNIDKCFGEEKEARARVYEDMKIEGSAIPDLKGSRINIEADSETQQVRSLQKSSVDKRHRSSLNKNKQPKKKIFSDPLPVIEKSEAQKYEINTKSKVVRNYLPMDRGQPQQLANFLRVDLDLRKTFVPKKQFQKKPVEIDLDELRTTCMKGKQSKEEIKKNQKKYERGLSVIQQVVTCLTSSKNSSLIYDTEQRQVNISATVSNLKDQDERKPGDTTNDGTSQSSNKQSKRIKMQSGENIYFRAFYSKV